MKNYTLNRVKTEKITKNRVYSLNLNAEHPGFQKLVLLVQRSEIDSGEKFTIWIANENQTSFFTENTDADSIYRANRGFKNWQIEHLNLAVTFDDTSKIMHVSFPCLSYFNNKFTSFGLSLCKILSDNCVHFANVNQYGLVYSHIDRLISNGLWLHLDDKGLRVDFNG